MIRLCSLLKIVLAAFFVVSVTIARAQDADDAKPASAPAQSTEAKPQTYSQAQIDSGKALFRQNCGFCHGRDATGGETGPDLTRSKLVADDENGDKIGPVVRNGRTDKGMPRFELGNDQIASLVAFIHAQHDKPPRQNGDRKGVDPSDLQTGNVEAGLRYFNGAGGCSNCHSPTGDLAGVASRYQGLQLEQEMLYPRRARSHVTVTLASGQSITGVLAYRDEFTVGLFNADGYRSWRASDVKYKIDSPADAHVEQFPKYTDENIHDLMAYLQTLR